jgi:hypothetical protein
MPRVLEQGCRQRGVSGSLREGTMMTFAEFQASGVDCADLGAALSDGHWKYSGYVGRGRIYAGGLWIERKPEQGWPNGDERQWFLLLDRYDDLSDDLGDFERRLYEWAVSSGWLD